MSRPIAIFGLCSVLACWATACSRGLGLRDSEGVAVTHGPIVGALSEDSVSVMVRLSGPGFVGLVYGDDPELAYEGHWTPTSVTQAEHDHTAHFRLDGLEPDTTYYYDVLVEGTRQHLRQPSSFRTAPPAGSVTSFRFAVLADATDAPNRDSPTFYALAGHDPAFVLQIGDMDHRDPGSDQGDIEQWRAMHREQLGGFSQGRQLSDHVLSSFPFMHIWDDHDYGNNNADMRAPWKHLAAQAFKEYYPLPPLPNPQQGLWHSFRYAQAEFFMLDLRSQRTPNDAENIPSKSMLAGAEIEDDQKRWLLRRLSESAATWKFIISSSVWNPNSKPRDSWACYPIEQRELLDYIRENGIKGVIVISGDLHSAGGIDDGSNSGVPEISVPPTNFDSQEGCTGGVCGTWSEGILSGNNPSGFALIEVIYDRGIDLALLQAWSSRDELRMEYGVGLGGS